MSTIHRAFVGAAVSLLAFLTAADAEASRRRVVQHPAPPFNIAFTEGGYANATSVEQGDPIRFHIATSVSPFRVRIINLAQPNDTIREISNLQSSPQNCSGRFTQGCDWAVTTTLDVPVSWRSGYYAAVFPTAFGDRYIPFIVRENTPGSTSQIVVVASTHTWQAYNAFGGRSLYPSNDPRRATLLSYDRPYDAENGLGRYGAFEKHFVDWMTAENRNFEVITDVDLEDPTILSRYNLVVLPGHSEYWTPSGRANLEQFHRNGGHIAVLNGNTMWWQIRLEDDDRTIAGFKGATYDPALDAGSPLATTHFFSSPVNNPENRLLGTSFRNGGYANRLNDTSNELLPVEQRTPWTVTNADHWIFNGTGLRNGDTFGRETVGLEVDGAVFNCDNFGNIIGVEGSDETPLNYQILATTPASEGWGTLGFLVNEAGGAVFNAATNGWVWGLATNPLVRTITGNVIDRLSSGSRQTYNPVQSTILAQDLFNCPQPVGATGWRSGAIRPNVNSACAYEGPGGLELAGADALAIGRNLAPIGQGHAKVDLRFYIRADDLQQRTQYPMPIVTLEERTDRSQRQVALIEVDATSGKRIRIARRSPNGAFSASPDWVTLSDGWHLVEATWRSPGTITLQVDGGTALTLENPDAGQTVNGVVVEFPKAELTTAGRVCVDAIAVGTEKPPHVPALK